MTSEIAVMNQRTVALAADSAVTLVDVGTVEMPKLDVPGAVGERLGKPERCRSWLARIFRPV